MHSTIVLTKWNCVRPQVRIIGSSNRDLISTSSLFETSPMPGRDSFLVLSRYQSFPFKSGALNFGMSKTRIMNETRKRGMKFVAVIDSSPYQSERLIDQRYSFFSDRRGILTYRQRSINEGLLISLSKSFFESLTSKK